MKMLNSQTILGIILIIVGLGLSLTGVGAIYGIPLFLLGLFLVIFKDEENKIEKINNHKNKPSESPNRSKLRGIKIHEELID